MKNTLKKNHIEYSIYFSKKVQTNSLSIKHDIEQLMLSFYFHQADCNFLFENESQKSAHIHLVFLRTYIEELGIEIDPLLHKQGEEQAICCHSQLILSQILTNKYAPTLKNIFIKNKAMELLLYILQLQNNTLSSPSFDTCKFLTSPIEKVKIEEAKMILLDNLQDTPTIPELAKRIGTNQCYLKKGFKELFGLTIFDFVQEQKMKKAQMLMTTQPELTIGEIAEMLGYANMGNFSHAFIRHTGIRPKQFLNAKVLPF